MTDENADLRLGIDFGGTKTEIIGLNAKNGKELYRKRIPTPRNDYQMTLQSFKELTEEAEKIIGMGGSLGIGMPGSISKDNGMVKNSNSTWINDKPLKKDLEEFMNRPLRIENDANCMALSEATDGAAKGASVVFGVIIGTGCGGGVVINGKTIIGVNGIAGEWGHNPLVMPRMYVPKNFKIEKFESKHKETRPYPFITHDKDWNEMPGPVCYCGRRNCQELWMSGTGLKRDYAHVTGENLSTHQIVANAKKAEPKATAALDRFKDRLARGLGVVINLIDPDVIVFGGGLSSVDSLYTDIPKIWGNYITSKIIHTQLKPAVHGDSSGVRGAAWLWPKK